MTHDVIVVGAGPAGATAAKVLAENGVSVLLLDKHTFPRDKPCGGGLPTRILKRYPYIQKNGLIDSYSHRLCVHSTSLQNQAHLDHPEPIVAMVRRPTFDAGLVTLATDSGADLKAGVAATRITTTKYRAHVTLNDGTFTPASYVIVATGMGSRITRDLGYHLSHRHIGACILEEYPVPRPVMDQVFGEDRCIHILLNVLGIAGYGWVFPKKDHVNIGLCEFYQALPRRRLKKNLKQLYPQFITLLKDHKIIPDTVTVGSPRGGVFPTLPQDQTYGDCTLLCGDAGGLVNPLTGEGIYYAMVSGELAARTVLHALKEGDPNTSSLFQYQRLWMRDFGDDYRTFYRVSRQWWNPAETLVRIIEQDPQLKELALSLVMGPTKVRDIRWTIGRRLIIGYVKARLGRF